MQAKPYSELAVITTNHTSWLLHGERPGGPLSLSNGTSPKWADYFGGHFSDENATRANAALSTNSLKAPTRYLSCSVALQRQQGKSYESKAVDRNRQGETAERSSGLAFIPARGWHWSNSTRHRDLRQHNGRRAGILRHIPLRPIICNSLADPSIRLILRPHLNDRSELQGISECQRKLVWRFERGRWRVCEVELAVSTRESVHERAAVQLCVHESVGSRQHIPASL